MLDGLAFDALPVGEDVFGAAEVGVRRGHVAQALVIAAMVVVLDEGADLCLEIAWQEVILQQDPVLQGLMPALDLPLGLGMIRRAADVFHILVSEPFGQVARDVARAVVREQARLGLLVIWAPKVTLTKPFKYNGLVF